MSGVLPSDNGFLYIIPCVLLAFFTYRFVLLVFPSFPLFFALLDPSLALFLYFLLFPMLTYYRNSPLSLTFTLFQHIYTPHALSFLPFLLAPKNFSFLGWILLLPSPLSRLFLLSSPLKQNLYRIYTTYETKRYLWVFVSRCGSPPIGWVTFFTSFCFFLFRSPSLCVFVLPFLPRHLASFHSRFTHFATIFSLVRSLILVGLSLHHHLLIYSYLLPVFFIFLLS